MTQQGPFVVELSTLKPGVNQLYLEGKEQDIGVSSEDVDLDGPIVLEGDFVRTETNVEVQAMVRALVRQVCDRCLKPVETALAVPLRLFCEKRSGRDSRGGIEDSAADAPSPGGRSDLEIVVGDVVIRAGAGADEGQLTRAIRAARAAAP